MSENRVLEKEGAKVFSKLVDVQYWNLELFNRYKMRKFSALSNEKIHSPLSSQPLLIDHDVEFLNTINKMRGLEVFYANLLLLLAFLLLFAYAFQLIWPHALV